MRSFTDWWRLERDGREKFHRLVETGETAVRSFTDWWRLERDGREKFHRLVETGERRP